MLGVEGLTVRYGAHTALEDATVRFAPGSFSAVIGPNGAGKSTLLKTVVGLSAPAAGRVTFGPGMGAQSDVAYVPQQQTLDWGFPVTVWDVAMMGRTGRVGWLRWPGRGDRAQVADALRQTGVYELRGRHIGALSGGQRQRVLLARMLARDARVLLLDEPLTGVDAATQEQLMELLRAQADAGRAVVMVTHDLEQASRWCDHLVLVNRRVIADGTPAEVYTPRNIEATFSSSHLGHTHAEA
ncbi:metal ABC transporter ATP-binding protein [Deinococcus budaensis]|uniref:Manganese/iron transport system ATP-binding protein n=1 Tax=Deinococcus budaensis TaxID=1665626 RepID=A0A7W8GGP6_9DEIO|nr:metal ABC transporter ATP-binding protein [Deinococcus budaensis]MBB5235331.1 manganese/iron transport system ATP-binding protein [Deinococcus budaensis]